MSAGQPSEHEPHPGAEAVKTHVVRLWRGFLMLIGGVLVAVVLGALWVLLNEMPIIPALTVIGLISAYALGVATDV